LLSLHTEGSSRVLDFAQSSSFLFPFLFTRWQLLFKLAYEQRYNIIYGLSFVAHSLACG
jgi:hypothetical protein